MIETYAAVREWRCDCADRTLLGYYSETGTLYISLRSHRRERRSYVCPLTAVGVRADCPRCGQRHVLCYDGATVEESSYAGPFPEAREGFTPSPAAAR